ncbi:hypothetical protein G5714_024642 [Onychostoma macrolepis]|uniref:Uncharacterized protein n=1 Tax=Onychostoma macrolepis TaxID=369639 RepID=A0A7J6BI05_9TELE|nr:hypothetical protein G5714_024642 [Onychostoma macrolepis]
MQRRFSDKKLLRLGQCKTLMRVGGRIRNLPGTRHLPGLPRRASGTLDVWPEPPFDLVVFPTRIPPGSTPTAGAERGEPSRYTPLARRGHGASNPPLVTREPDQGA